MKRLIALGLILVAGLVWAADKKTKEPTSTFKPSEEITAESAVSFPVDI